MDHTMESIILKELREFRTENNKKWEENERRWQENEKSWEINDKKLEEMNQKIDETNVRIDETNQRLDETNQRIDETNQRLDETNVRIDETNQRLDETNVRIDETNQRLDGTNERVTALEEGRKKDRRDILVVLDTMEKSISNQFSEMKEYFDAKFDKVFSAQRLSDIDDEQFKKLFCSHEKRLNFYNARLNYLEEWKKQFDLGEYTAV